MFGGDSGRAFGIEAKPIARIERRRSLRLAFWIPIAAASSAKSWSNPGGLRDRLPFELRFVG
jgi:hypothetical protein